MTENLKEPRLVTRKFLAKPQREGVGAVVRRSIGRWLIQHNMSYYVLQNVIFLFFCLQNFT